MAMRTYEIMGAGFYLQGCVNEQNFSRMRWLMDKLAKDLAAEPTIIGAQKYELEEQNELFDFSGSSQRASL